jgi:hypothetical protein
LGLKGQAGAGSDRTGAIYGNADQPTECYLESLTKS